MSSSSLGGLDHMTRVLNPEQERVLANERAFLLNLKQLLGELGCHEDDLEILQDSIVKLDELFSLVIVGEFNSGKSSFLNALLGDHFLREGVTPTTDRINVIKYGEPTRAPQVSKTDSYCDLSIYLS